MFEDPENLDFDLIKALLDESRLLGNRPDGPTLGFALRKTINRMSEQLLENARELHLMTRLEAAAGLAKRLPFEVNIWRAQNNYYAMLLRRLPEFLSRAGTGDNHAQQWINLFLALGVNLLVSPQSI